MKFTVAQFISQFGLDQQKSTPVSFTATSRNAP
jgi:hypothetical protein